MVLGQELQIFQMDHWMQAQRPIVDWFAQELLEGVAIDNVEDCVEWVSRLFVCTRYDHFK